MADVTKKIAVSLDMLGNKLKGFALEQIESTDREHPITTKEGNMGEIRYDDDVTKLRYYEGQDQSGNHLWPALAKDADVQELLKWKEGIEAEELWGKTGFSLSGGGNVGIGAAGKVGVAPSFAAAGLKPTQIVYTYNVCGTSHTVTRTGDAISTGISDMEYSAADTTKEGTIITVNAVATYANGKTKSASVSWRVFDQMYIFLKADKSLGGVDRTFMSTNAVKTSTAKGGTYNVDLANDSYILFGVPQGLGTINSIKSAGFDVPFELVGTIKIPGEFRVYATSNKIAAGNGYSLVIA